MKKLLALILSIALCFTVFAGCFATSAAAPDFSVSANGNVVTVSGTIAENSQYAVMLKITLDDDLTLASIADGNGTPLEAYAEDKETWHYVLDNTGKIISALELYNDTFTYVITVNAPANDSCEAPSDPYAVSVVADYADYNADAPTLENYEGTANVVVPAKAHTPAEAVKENEVAAEVGKEGSYDNVVYCSACNTELSRENVKVPALEPEEPEHVCTYGELQYRVEANGTTYGACVTYKVCTDETCAKEVVVKTVTNPAVYKAPVLTAGLAMAIRIEKGTLESTYSDIHMICAKDTYTGNEKTGVEVTSKIAWYKDANAPTRFTFDYTGISAKEMCSDFLIRIYGTDAEGNVIMLADSTYSFVKYISNNYVKTTISPETKQLLADLATYGAKAQKYMDYRVDTTPLTMVNITTAKPLPTTFNTEGIGNVGFNIYKTPIVGNSISITLSFAKTSVAAYGSDVYVTIDYATTTGGTEQKVVTFDQLVYNSTNSRYEVVYNEMTAATAYKAFTVKVMTSSQTDPLASSVYSFEKYTENKYNNDSSSDVTILAQAIINYSQSAEAYFNSML